MAHRKGTVSTHWAVVLVAAAMIHVLSGLPEKAEAGRFEEARLATTAALAAEDEGRFEDASRQLEAALALRPNHPGLIFFLAQTEASSGNTDGAKSQLARYAAMGLTTDLSRVAVFQGFLEDADFAETRAALSANAEPQGTVTVALRSRSPLLLTEGIAYDRKEKRWFLGSVYEARIAAATRDGTLSAFAEAPGSLWSAMGLKVDEKRGLLWVATAATAQTRGIGEADHGKAGLVAFDLKTGAPEVTWQADEKTHWFGDLILTRDGKVILSDSLNPTLLIWSPQTGAAAPLVAFEDFVSPQGLVLSKDQKTLFLADYAMGLFRIDLATGAVSPILPSADFAPYGIDGLYRHGHDLIAIQNGTNPQRIIRIRLDDEAPRVTGWQVLAANHPDFLEPTLGEVRGNRFYFLANSGWPLFGEPPFDEDAIRRDLPPPVILSVSLK